MGMYRTILLLVTSLIMGCSSSPETKPTPLDRVASEAESNEATETAVGEITGYTTAPRGEMDGFTLDSGTTVHFPPHAASQLRPLLEKGQKVSVIGMVRAGPQGEVLEASEVKNLESGKSVDIASIAPPQSQFSD